MRKLVLIVVLIGNGFSSFAQMEWINYKNSGQYNDAFSCIEFDDNNNPWVGTILNGLHHFNHSTYLDYNTSNSPLPNNKIYDLLFSDDKQLWIATANGLALFKENSWTTYTIENSNLTSNTILSLAKGIGGRIWIGTDKGVLDGLNGQIYNQTNTPLIGNIFYHIFTDSKENTWFATNEEVARFDGENWTVYNAENSILPAELALFIAEDNTGKIWVSMGNTYSGTLAAFDGESWRLFDENILYNLTSRISSIVTFADGTNWFGTHDKGLIRMKDSVWTAFTTDNSDIPINQIICMKKDRENKLWLGHRNGLTKVQTGDPLSTGLSLNSELVVFPNPVTEQTSLFFPNASDNSFSFEVLNLKGQIVQQEQNVIGKTVFERKGLDSGVYIFRIYTSGNVISKKIILK